MVRKVIQILISVLIVFLSLFGLKRLTFETDILKVMPKNVPAVEALQDFQKYFAEDQQVVVVLESKDGEIYPEDVEGLALFLREILEECEVTYRSHLEETPNLLAKSLGLIWSYADEQEVERLVQNFSSEEALRSHLDSVLENVQNSADQERAIMDVYDPLGFLKHAAISSLAKSQASFQGVDQKHYLLMISKKERNTTGYHDDALWVQDIRETIHKWIIDEEYELSFQITGGPAYNAEIGAGMERDMSSTIIVTSLLVGILFLITQRSFIQLIIVSALTALTFFITLGVSGWVFGSLNMVSIGFAAILLGLVIDYAVVILREARHVNEGKATAKEIRNTVGGGILWAAVTTAIVFGLLVFSTFNGVRQLGGIIVIGLIIGALVMLIFTSYFLEKLPMKKLGKTSKPIVVPFAGLVSIIGIIILASSILFWQRGLPPVDMDLKMLEPGKSEAASAFEAIQENYEAWSNETLNLVAKEENIIKLSESVDKVHAQLELLLAQGKIASYQWAAGLVPDSKNYLSNFIKLKDIAQQKELFLKIADEVGFSEKGTALNYQILEQFDLLPESADSLISRCINDPIVGVMFHKDEKAYFSGSMKLNDENSDVMALQEQLTGVNTTGWTVLRTFLVPMVKRDFYVIFLPSAIVLLLALYLVFRTWKETLMVVIVLTLSLLLVNVVVVLTGQSWNFLSGIALPLVVGAGIDYSIHLIFSLRRQAGNLEAVWNSVGKAICFCGVSTAIGFGSLTTSSIEVLKGMGLLCSIGILITMSLSLLVIPCLWARWHRSTR